VDRSIITLSTAQRGVLGGRPAGWMHWVGPEILCFATAMFHSPSSRGRCPQRARQGKYPWGVKGSFQRGLIPQPLRRSSTGHGSFQLGFHMFTYDTGAGLCVVANGTLTAGACSDVHLLRKICLTGSLRSSGVHIPTKVSEQFTPGQNHTSPALDRVPEALPQPVLSEHFA
jgi:hypothetical protein